MGSILNFILVLIFFYLIYQIFLRPLFSQNNSFKSSRNKEVHEEPHVDDTSKTSKKIDMSKVEDADYKEID